jgi:hypothetical protein
MGSVGFSHELNLIWRGPVNDKTHKKPVRIVCVPDEIRTWYLSHISQLEPPFSLSTYKSKGNVVLVHTTRVYGETGLQLHTFLKCAPII